MKPAEAPELDAWVLVSTVAEMAGVPRQTVNRWVVSGRFKTLRRLTPASGAPGVTRPIYVVGRKEAEKIAQRKNDDRRARAKAKAKPKAKSR